MTGHEQYEILCALAATGQLTAPERLTFDEHFLHCRDCRDRLHDLTSVGMQLQYEAAFHPIVASLPTGSVERFRARAIQEGLMLRSEPARLSTSYALASVAVFFFILSSLIVMPPGRKAAERVAISAAASIPTGQSLPVSVIRTKLLPRPSKVTHALFVRHDVVRRADASAEDTSQAAQRFLRTMPPRYPFFESQSATKSPRDSYPALSGSQISHLNLFRDIHDEQDRNSDGIASTGRPINIASAGNTFDFAADIRQLHFQLPTAQ
jgi:hypothetical protein